MIPLRDDIPSQRYPAVTVTLIVVNVLVFMRELALGPAAEEFLLRWGIVPLLYTQPDVRSFFPAHMLLAPLFTSMFLHGGWIHLIGNMWILWVFGDNVEDRLGAMRFLGFYILGGVTSGVLHILTNAGSGVPTIGASGAVAAVMGAYFRFYPRARVRAVIPPFIFWPVFDLPAVLFLGWWIVLQFFNGTLSLLSGTAVGGVAWWAHVGGFIYGAWTAVRITPVRRSIWDD